MTAWNCLIICQRRSPCGERGLKWKIKTIDDPNELVAPRAGSVG